MGRTLTHPDDVARQSPKPKVHSVGDSSIAVRKHSIHLEPDPARVIARLFVSGGETRARAIINRVLGLSDAEVLNLVAEVLDGFSSRHRDIVGVLRTHFEHIAHLVPDLSKLSEKRRLLIGAYFTAEYSLESVALFNPSVVLHPDQEGLGPGEHRFMMSLRACGEGHISSIEFRSGIIDAQGQMVLDPITRYAAAAQPVADKHYEKHPFALKLTEIKAYNALAGFVLDALPDCFTFEELHHVVEDRRRFCGDPESFAATADNMLWLARSNYHLQFPAQSRASERVIFPVTDNESRGIEDARFVRFVYPDGRVVYYATYTAYNGFTILPQFIETKDFRRFHVITLNGRYAQNKGMALFPRKVNGQYMMLSRVDGESLYLMASDNLHFWNEAEKLCEPECPWEFIQIGNCGSPLETEAGWLVLTHGVGPMRRYCIGAMLLDREEPSRVIGQLDSPLLVPAEDEREGYVPNVVYSCGAMINNGDLIIPYAVSDTSTRVVTVSVSELLGHLTA